MKLVPFYLILLFCLFLLACGKKDLPPVSFPPLLKISIENVVNGQPLVLNTGAYTNANGDAFTVTRYRYFISNIELTADDGSKYTESESYHLIDQEDAASMQFVISPPAGNYKSVKFLLGVDSLKNVSGAQTGALGPGSGMFWDWNSGYVMAQFEGTSASSPEGILLFHTGGFSGKFNVLRWVSLNFPTPAIAANDKMPVIHITSDVAEWFKTPVTIDFSKLYINNGGQNACTIADNYADMFKVQRVD